MKTVYGNRINYFFVVVGLGIIVSLVVTSVFDFRQIVGYTEINTHFEILFRIFLWVTAVLLIVDYLFFFRALHIARRCYRSWGLSWVKVAREIIRMGIYKARVMEQSEFIRLKQRKELKGSFSTKRSWG